MSESEAESSGGSEDDEEDDGATLLGHARTCSLSNPCWCVAPSEWGQFACTARPVQMEMSSDLEMSTAESLSPAALLLWRQAESADSRQDAEMAIQAITAELLVAFYERVDPSKVCNVGPILAMCSDKEIIQNVTDKYGAAEAASLLPPPLAAAVAPPSPQTHAQAQVQALPGAEAAAKRTGQSELSSGEQLPGGQRGWGGAGAECLESSPNASELPALLIPVRLRHCDPADDTDEDEDEDEDEEEDGGGGDDDGEEDEGIENEHEVATDAYDCEFDCGFRGSYAEAEEHESTCTHRPEHPSSPASSAPPFRHATCRHWLTCGRDPYSFSRVLAEGFEGRESALGSLSKEAVVDLDAGPAAVYFEAWRCAWTCDRCGVEGRLRQVYSCRACGFDLCVPCALAVEVSTPACPRPAGATVRWVDLHGEPGCHVSAPEGHAGEADAKNDRSSDYD